MYKILALLLIAPSLAFSQVEYQDVFRDLQYDQELPEHYMRSDSRVKNAVSSPESGGLPSHAVINKSDCDKFNVRYQKIQVLSGQDDCDFTRSMQIVGFIDPISLGRYAISWQPQLGSNLALDVMAYYENSRAATPFAKSVGLFNENLESFWGIGAGVGLKWYVTEWMWKSSFYVEPRVKVGFYSQNGVGFTAPGENPFEAISITPELILGWERVFESGFVIGASLGVEKLFAIPLAADLPYVPNISVSPVLEVGYAW